MAFDRARWLVRCYYAALLYFALALLPEWSGLIERGNPALLWPVSWLEMVDARHGTLFILSLYLFGATFAAIFPERRLARSLAFAGLFEFVALNNSSGKIGHSLHLWVITSALLIFLPKLQSPIPSRSVRQTYLTVFWGSQALILLTYSMAGLGKLAGAFYQLSHQQNNAFLPGALAQIVAERLVETNSQSLLGPWLINHPRCGWPMLLADIYLQLFALVAAFRPSLQKIWAIGLIVFHIFSWLLLTINFAQSGLLIALFLLNSPFARSKFDFRETLRDLPLFGIAFRRTLPKPCAS